MKMKPTRPFDNFNVSGSFTLGFATILWTSSIYSGGNASSGRQEHLVRFTVSKPFLCHLSRRSRLQKTLIKPSVGLNGIFLHEKIIRNQDIKLFS